MQDESYQNKRERDRDRERDYTYKLKHSHLEMPKKKKHFAICITKATLCIAKSIHLHWTIIPYELEHLHYKYNVNV